MPDKTILVAAVYPSMPIDAFVKLTEGMLAMLPAGIPDEKLLVANNTEGGFSMVVADDVELARCFTTGHFEIRWIDT